MASDVSSVPTILAPACRPWGSDVAAVVCRAWTLSVGGHHAQSPVIGVEFDFWSLASHELSKLNYHHQKNSVSPNSKI